jgi:hypothetical protein
MASTERKWIALELSPLGETKMLEGSLPNILRSTIKDCPPDLEIFVPAMQVHRSGRPYLYRLMEGYVFIQSGLAEIEYFRLARTSYIESVMSTHTSDGMKTCLLLPDRDVEKLKSQLLNLSREMFKHGDCVKVLNGSFSRMTGHVVCPGESHSDVFFALRSLRVIKTLKNTSLALHDEGATEVPNFESAHLHAHPRSIFDLKECLDSKEPPRNV